MPPCVSEQPDNTAVISRHQFRTKTAAVVFFIIAVLAGFSALLPLDRPLFLIAPVALVGVAHSWGLYKIGPLKLAEARRLRLGRGTPLFGKLFITFEFVALLAIGALVIWARFIL